MTTLQTAGEALDSADKLKELIARQAVEIERLRKDANRLAWMLSDESDANTCQSVPHRRIIEAAWEAVTDCGDNYTADQKRAAIDAVIQKETP